MNLRVEIDPGAGFCGGVIRAISKAESFLDNAPDGGRLYSLGAIVHNEAELDRLEAKGLSIISREDFGKLPKGSTVFIRAHGEPPETYGMVSSEGLSLIDCTCPVVLRLQSEIRAAHERVSSCSPHGQVIIFGKIGHAEVLGLVGQTGGDAVVVENAAMMEDLISQGKIRLDAPLEIFSQTTKNPSEYSALCEELSSLVRKANGLSESDGLTGRLTVHNSICAQVASRYRRLSSFAAGHDVIVFVSGKESSNGRVLSELCRRTNPRTHNVTSPSEIDSSWFRDGDRVGVSGATSAPKWLLEDIGKKILQL